MTSLNSPPRRVLVPVEKAALVTKTLKTLGVLAQQTPFSVELLHVWEPLPFTPPEASYFTEGQLQSYRQAAEAHAQTELSEAKKLAESVGLRVDRQLVENGDPATSIVDVAAERNVDWIVISSHQRRGVSRWFLGSVAERVTVAADRPVLVVSVR